MALDKLVDSSQLNGALGSTADAIREKTGGTSLLEWDMDTGFEVAIGTILTPTDGSIPTKTSSDLTVSGATVTAPAGYYATSVSKSVASGSATTPATTIPANPVISVDGSGLITAVTNISKDITPTVSAGYVSSGTAGTVTASGSNTSQLSTQAGTTITPTESEQTAVAKGKFTTGIVKVGAISSTYVGSDIPQNDSDDLTASGATVTAPAGYYAQEATKTIASGSVTQNAPTVNTSTGVVTATSTVTAGYVSAETKSNTLSLSTQAGKTVSPTESEQTAVASGKYTTGAVKVGAISSTYVGSGIAKNDSDDLTASGATVTAPAGYYAEDATKTIASGSVTQNAPTVNSSTGVVTATSTVTAGYVGADTKSNTLQLTTQAAQTITPGTSDKEIAAGKYLTGKQTIKGDANLVAGNIKNGTSIFGVSGTFSKANTVSSGQTAAGAAQIRSGYSAFVDGAEVKGSLGNTSVTQGTTTISGTTVTRGTATWGNGVITSGSIGAAKFGNDVATGKTTSSYKDISDTTEAPVLVSGSYLYINKGYTDDLKISLAKLVPDGASADLASDKILSGYSAYNNDGVLVAGNIPTQTALTVNGKTVTAPAGYFASNTTASVALGTVTSGTASITSLTKTYNSTSGKFDVTGSANVSAPTVGTAGYVSSSEGTKNAKSGGATVSATLDKIIGSTAITGTTTKKPSITKQNVPSGVTQAASGDATTTAPSSGVYVAVKSAANTGTLTATPSVTTAGYGTADYHGISAHTATVGASASDVTYVPITTTSASVSGKTVSYGSGWITAGSKSVAVGTVTSGSATIDSATFAYNSTNGNFDVTGSKAIGAPTVGTAGYVSSTEGTKNGNTASLATTVAKIVGSTAITGTTTKKPSITKQDVPSGVTQAASGNATTTAPSSGVYVAVKSAANTGTLTATPSVTIAGYGDATNHGIAGNTATVGASASDMTYVPITTTTASVSGKTVSYGSGWITAGSSSVADGAYSASVSSHTISTNPAVTGSIAGTVTNIGTTTKPSGTDGTDYWTITPSGSVTTTGVSSAKGKATIGTAGYIAAGNKETSASTVNITPTVTNGTARYIQKATTSVSNGTATATAGTASTSVTGMVTTETNTGYSVSASATGGNASVTASSATVNSGYAPSATTASTTAKSATGTSASNTKYIQKGVLGATVSANSGGSASISATGFTASSSATSYYVTLSTSAGSVKAKASVSTEGYVKSETAETGATSVSVSGNGNKLYVPAGGYAGSVSSHSITTAPSVTGALSGTGTNIGTTTKPSGTDGTDYWTFTPGGTGSNGVSTAKGKATISTAGYIPTGNNESSAHTVSITPTVSNGTARYLPKAVIAGSSTNATATTTVAPGTVSISKQSTPSGVTNAASGNATTTAPTSGVYVAVKATAAANSTGTTSSISGSGSATVSTAGYAPTSLTGSVTVSGTATAKTSAKDSSMTYVPITTASPAFTGGGLSGTATATGSGVSISDSTNNSGVSISTACTASRANVTYNGAVNGWVSKSSGTVALSSGSTAMTAKTYYVNGVTMATPSSGNRTFTVTAPSGGTNHTYTFTQAADGRTSIKVDNTLTMQWNATTESLDFVYT